MGSENATPPAPTQIGPYRILEQLGEGGMGSVYVAEQAAPVKRRVALKLIKLGMDSKAVVARFEQERQALALMQHDGIAKVYECGTSERGQPYFVMELVKGVPLVAYCDRHKLPLPARIALVQQVCDAVQHAHQKGVVHRDLKPGNVLVAEEGGKPRTKIIDFGLAKAMGQKLVEATLFTEAGQVMGTPEYMAPEQADSTHQDTDTRTDVYSLGVMLYEVLTGQLPFPGNELRRAGLIGMQRILREVDPPKPSTRISAAGAEAAPVAARRLTTPGALHKALRLDLDWLVLKALEKDPARRYQTANALLLDLQRYLDHEPLAAGPPSAGYRLKKLVRRYRAQFAAGTAVLGTAIVGAIVAVDQAIAAGENAAQATANATLAGQRATQNAELARSLTAKVRDFDQLAAVVLHEQAIVREAELYPPWPDRIEAMERWLRDDAGRLLAMRGEIDATVASLRSRALPASAEQLAADRRTHPTFAEYELVQRTVAALRHAQTIRDGAPLVVPELTREQQSLDAHALDMLAWQRVAPSSAARKVFGEEALGLALARLAAAKAKASALEYNAQQTLAWGLLANGQDDAALSASEQALDLAPDERTPVLEVSHRNLANAIANAQESLRRAERRLAELEDRVGARRTFRFELESQQFLHDTLTDLLRKLDVLAASRVPAVEQRLAWAKRIGDLTLAHPQARHTWAAVRAAVAANPKYAGHAIALTDRDVTGLVPIGENPATRLWEFYELRSAWDGRQDPGTIAIPQHRADGSIEVTGATGIVFVLLPGGTFRMGAQEQDRDAPGHDHDAVPHEAPVHEVTLAPFLLARHEMTRGQWERLTATRPFVTPDDVVQDGDAIAVGPAHPADSIHAQDADLWLGRHGLVLPTEAQWEYGCRAGTKTPWWPGPEAKDLQGCANVYDRTAAEWTPKRAPTPIVDGFAVFAPVGRFRANPFGLHDVHGNQTELCRDPYGSYLCGVRAGDGYRLDPAAGDYRAVRGGSALDDASGVRSTTRYSLAPSTRSSDLGLRAARVFSP